MAEKEVKYPEQAKQFAQDMEEIGLLWGLGRPLRYVELGRALRTSPASPTQTISLWARGMMPISGPASVAIEMMRLGALPPDGLSAVISVKKLRPRPIVK